MRKHHKKFISLNNLVPQTKNNEKLKQEVLINAGDIIMNCMTFTKIDAIEK